LLVADAFTGVGDQAEATKWRQKAAEQASKIKDAKVNDAKPKRERSENSL
jgi:hypothetical protein